MENSPPGIHAIPSGGAPGDGFLLSFVGWNSPADDAPFSLRPMATLAGNGVLLSVQLERNLVDMVGRPQTQAIAVDARTRNPNDLKRSFLLIAAVALDIKSFTLRNNVIEEKII
jgi:hypothetical protein